MRLILPITLMVVLIFIPLGPWADAQTRSIKLQTTETAIGKMVPGLIPDTLTVSPDGAHYAYAAKWLGPAEVVLDGARTGPRSSEIRALYISDDSKRLAYLAEEVMEGFVVVDGVISGRYDAVKDFKFSPGFYRK